MSDFFSSMAGRIDGTLAVLKPRLPSLFENGNGHLARDEAPAVESAEREAAPPIPRDVPKPAIAHPAPAAAVADERPAEPQRRKEARRGIVREESVQASEPQPAPRQSRKMAARSELPEAVPSVAPPRDAREPAPPVVQAAPLAIETPEPRVGSPTAARPEAPVWSPRPAPAPQQRAAAVRPAPLLPLQRATPAPPPFAPPPSSLLPKSARASVRDQARPAPPHGKTEEPTIHVSIGRIDIRAETQAQPQRKPVHASPVMSLDEYLRSRAK
ncbi:MAG: hypothetical protein JOZ72_13030 [Alphaproteobacteria bacterium]|nr:hypothetical protein [Alphaproteobacteria bacterium]